MITGREFGRTPLPLWAAGFVVLICAAILGLSGWREWEAQVRGQQGFAFDA